MKHVNQIIALFSILLMLGSCGGRGEVVEKVMPEGKPVMNTEPLFDHDQLITDGKERQEQVKKYGPLTLEDPELDSHETNRTMLNREDPLNHATLNDESKDFPISLNVENMEIRIFAKMFSEITGLNILVSDEVRGVVSARLENVPWTRAMDSILNIKGLATHIDNKSGIIRIHEQKRIAELEDFERTRREALQKTAELEKASEPIYTEVFKLFYTDPKDVSTVIKGVLGIKDDASSVSTTQIIVDERMNQLIIKARKVDLDMISKVIKNVDVRTKQVLIEAFIVEVTDDFAKALGTRLGIQVVDNAPNTLDGKDLAVEVNGIGGSIGGTTLQNVSELAVPGAFSGIGVVTGIGNARDLAFELSAMEQEGLTKVISNPRVFTLDNEEATIFQGDEIPYETVSQSGTEIQFKEAGLKLVVTPSVVGDGNIVMNITVNKDTADTSQANPPITKREIKTSLVSRDGSIVVIGGIYTETDSGSISKTPLFGDIPVLGKAFRKTDDAQNRKELMIFIAPQVI
jgi:type IV pilus assembly protein PilQ